MSKLTIIIPTKNRPNFLKMTLGYYAEQKCPFPIVVGDASDLQCFEQNQLAIAKLRNSLHIEHQTHPVHLSTQASLVQSLEKVETPYSVFTGDDDFLILARLHECVVFLDGHSDYNLGSGDLFIGFVKKVDGERFKIDRIVKGPCRQSVDNALPNSRLLHGFFPCLVKNTFSVHRTVNLRRTYKQIVEANLENDLYGNVLCEVAANGLNLIYGKELRLPGLYLLMLKHDQQFYQSRVTNINMINRITSDHWHSYLEIVIHLFTKALMEVESLNENEAKEIADTAVLYYLTNILMTGYPLEVLKQHGIYFSPLPRIKDLIPHEMALRFPILRKIWKRFKPEKGSLSCLLKPNSPYYNDFMPIYNLLSTS